MLDNFVRPIVELTFGSLVCLGMAALYTLGDTALLAVRTSRIDQLCNEGKRNAKRVKKLSLEPARHVAATQVGISLFSFASAGLGACAGVNIADLITDGKPSAVARVISVFLALMTLSFLNLVLAGLVPKAIALAAPDGWAMRLAPLIAFSSYLFAGLSKIALEVAKMLTLPLGIVARYEPPFITRDELEQIVGATGKSGQIDDEEAMIITRVFTLSERDARTVMTPRPDVSALPSNATLSQALESIVLSGHTRIPVYVGTIDNIIGILHAKDLLTLFATQVRNEEPAQSFNLETILRPAAFVLESHRVPDLLASMRGKNHQIAIVQDEFAGTEGIVTIEDLLEEIVGEIHDEHDVDEPAFEIDPMGRTRVDGRMPLDIFNERFGVEISDEDYNTVGGFVFGAIGRELVLGDSVTEHGLCFTVDFLDGRSTLLRVVESDSEEV